MATHKVPVVSLPSLPSLPKSRKSKPTHDCACGCGMGTKGTWFPGHDGRATGWALRVIRGVMTIEDVPSNERQGAVIMLGRHGHPELGVVVPADIKFLQSHRAA